MHPAKNEKKKKIDIQGECNAITRTDGKLIVAAQSSV